MSASLLLALGVATQSATAEQLTPGRLPFASFFHLVEGLFNDASASLPGETDGRDAGAHGTKADRGSGHAPGVGKGQLPPAGNGAPQPGKAGLSGSIPRGFDARTSVLDQSRTNAKETWYKNADGSLTERVSQTPVNYKNSAGAWQSVDASLTKVGTGYSNKAAPFDLTIAGTSQPGAGARAESASGTDEISASTSPSPSVPGSALPTASPSPSGSVGTSSTGNLVSLSFGSGESLAWSLAGAADVPGSASGDAVTFAGILPSTNLVLTSEPYGVQEDFQLESASSPNTFVLPLSLTGLSLREDASAGAWELVDGSGSVVATLPTPWASDASELSTGSASAYTESVAYGVTTRDGVESLTLTVPESWLEDASRVFPVTVDPTVELAGAGGSWSKYVNSACTVSCYDNSSGYLQVGYSVSGIGAESFLDFPASNFVGTGYHVSSAQFAAFMAFDANTADEAYYINPIKSSWSASGSETWPSGGIGAAGTNVPSLWGEFGEWTGSSKAATCTIEGTSTSGKWTYVNMSDTASMEDFDAWSTGNTPYYGIAVTGYSYTNTGYWKQLASSLDGGCSPYVYITYTPDAAAVTTVVSPVSGTALDTLTPTLTVSSTDATSYPGATTKYEFAVFKATGTTSTPVVTSTASAASSYTIPSGKLTWGNAYVWEAAAWNGNQWGPWTAGTTFTTTAPPPVLTGSLSQNSSGHGFDAALGNYTTSATDADIAGVGPAVSIVRDYNSMDARTSDALGQGWSSELDAKVTQVLNGAGTSVTEAVVTYPDGEEVAFGLNADGTYSPPEGRYATLNFSSSSGYTLVDKEGTTYSFTHVITAAASGVAGVYGLAYIADHAGRKLVFTWSGSSGGHVTVITSAVTGRYVSMVWATPSGATSAHVTNITTNDAVAGEGFTSQAWYYGYTGDELTTVCAPQAQVPASGSAVSSTKCTQYSYKAGTVYQLAVEDSGAAQYWPLDEAAGSSSAVTLIAAGYEHGALTYNNVTLGAPAHLASSTATTASFNGSSSYAQLPNGLTMSSDLLSVSLWFETTSSATGTLLSTDHDLPGTASPTGGAMPVLYVGSDGKLHGHFWDGTASGISSSGVVNDGEWHHVVLSSTGTGQALYLDGARVGSLSNTVLNEDPYEVVGAGLYNNEGWPDAPSGDTWNYFSGRISDVAYWPRALSTSEVAQLYTAGTLSSAQLTEITRPNAAALSGVQPAAQVTYDSVTGRVTQVVDSNGGTWQVGLPSVYGSSYIYRAAIDAFAPQHVWKLNDPASSTVVTDDIDADTWYGTNAGTAQYNNVTLGASGTSEMSSWAGAQFDGTSSYVELPNGVLNAATNTSTPSQSTSVSIGLWFKVASGAVSQVLLGAGGASVTASSQAGFDDALYIGSDGKLVGELWTGDALTPMKSASAVNDGKWHLAILAGDAANSKQYLYVDGKEVASKSGAISMSDTYVSLGAGWMGGSWPDDSRSGASAAVQYFAGDMADVSVYRSALTDGDVSAIWQAYRDSDGSYNPLEQVEVTDPADSFTGTAHAEYYYYDPQNAMRLVRHADGLGAATTYGYDTGGFLNTVVDPNGDETITGHDQRGDQVSETTCQLLSANECSTSYSSYYWSANNLALTSQDVRADLPVTSSDARSASASDTTYQTTYTYDANGNQLTNKDPLGRVTTSVYTDGTTAFPACDARSTGAPAGLLAATTSPGGAVTRYTYYADGDTCTVINPDGLVTYFTYDGLGRMTSKTVGKQRAGDWPLTDAAGATTVGDTSGLGETGIATDVTFNGSYAAFPGTSGQGIVAASPVLNTAASYSISAWVNPSNPSGYQPVVNICGTNHCVVYLEENGSGQWEFAAENSDASSSSDVEVNTSSTVSTGVWAMVTGTFDASAHTLTLYVNGAKVGAVAWATPWSGPGPLTIGAGRYVGASANGGTFTGGIANVQAYQRTLSSTEVATLFNEGRGGAVLPDPATDDQTTTYTYDGQGRLVQTVAPPVTDALTSTTHTGVTTVTYDDDGNVTTSTVSDSTGGDAPRETQYTYNGYDQLQQKTDPEQHSTSYTYDLFGNTETVTDALGRETKTLYDADNRKRATYLAGTAEDGTASSGTDLLDEEWTYDAGGRLATDVVDPGKLDYTTSYTYYDNNLPYQVTKTDGTSSYIQSTSTYDGAGNVLTQAANNGVTTTDYVYDAAGQQTTATVDPSGADRVTASTYTPDGYVQETKVTGVTDAAGDRGTVADTTHTFDALGNTVGTSVANGSTWYSTINELDEHGRVLSTTDPLGNTTYYGYDQSGAQTTVTSPVVTATAYTASGGATNTNSVAVTSVGYNTFGQKAESVDADGGETRYSYGLDGELTATIAPNPAGTGTSETTYQYDNDGETQTVTDPIAYATSSASGETITYGYNQLGKVTSEKTADLVTGQTATTGYTYDALGRTVAETDPTGAQTGTVYDYLGRVQSSSVIDRSAGPASDTTETYTTTNTYADQGGWLSQQTAPSGAYIQYGYDSLGEETSTTDAYQHTSTAVYDGAGQVVKSTAPDGTYMTTAYDEAGRPVAAGQYTSAQVQVAGSSNRYDADGRVISSTVYQSGNPASSLASGGELAPGTWLASTSVTLIMQADGNLVLYDSNGSQLWASGTAGNPGAYAQMQADGNFAVLSSSGTTLWSTGTTADAGATLNVQNDGNLVVDSASGTAVWASGTTGHTNPTSQLFPSATSDTSIYSYDATGMLTSETQPVDADTADNITVSYGYDLAGHQTAYTDGNGNTTFTTYNAAGLPVTQVEPATAAYTAAADLTTTNTYDADGDLQTQTLPGGVTLGYTYDGRGELLSETGNGAEAATGTRSFTYDLDGRTLTADTSNTVTVTATPSPSPTGTSSSSNATQENFTYNDRGELLTAANATGALGAGSSRFTYTGDGLMASRTDASGTTTYTYDNDGRPYQAVDAATGTTLTYSYNANSQPSAITYGTAGNQEVFGYDNADRLSSDELETSSGTAIKTLSYGYDEAGDLTSKTDSAGTANTYTYDEAGRLTSWTAAATSGYSGTGTCTTSGTLTCYAYDKDSNRIQSGANVYTYNTQDELTSDGVHTYTYTARGTLQTDTTSAGGTSSYQDDAFGQQVSAGTEQYTYDATGRLIRTLNGATGASTTLAYSGTGNLLASDGTSTYSRTAGGALLGENTNGTTALIWTDQHTDVVGTFTPTGTTLTGTEAYDPLGKVLSNTGTTTTLTVGYQSEFTDAATGHVNMAARWYNPSNGQFTSKDTIQNPATPNTANANPFAYGDGSPLGGTDPTGHNWLTDGIGVELDIDKQIASGFGKGLVNWFVNRDDPTQEKKDIKRLVSSAGKDAAKYAASKNPIDLEKSLVNLVSTVVPVKQMVQAAIVSYKDFRSGNWDKLGADIFGLAADVVSVASAVVPLVKVLVPDVVPTGVLDVGTPAVDDGAAALTDVSPPASSAVEPAVPSDTPPPVTAVKPVDTGSAPATVDESPIGRTVPKPSKVDDPSPETSPKPAKPKPENDDEPGDVAQTGGSSFRRPRSEIDFETEWADHAYNQIRADPQLGAVSETASEYGFSSDKIDQIYNHLFVDEHELDGGMGQFDSNPRIARAWQRLQDGVPHSSDIELLNHELYESTWMEQNGSQNYVMAHQATLDAGYTWDEFGPEQDGIPYR